MGRAVAALAVGHDFLVGRDAGGFIHRAQLVGRFVRAVGAEVAAPLDVHGAGDRAAALRPHGRAVVFAVAARVEDHDVRPAEALLDIAPCGNRLRLRRACPRALGRRLCLARHGQGRARPGVEAAVEDLHPRMAEVLEEPEGARGPHARLLVVHDDRGVRVDSSEVEEVIDDPHEGLERRRIRVDEREAPEIEMDGAGDVSGREVFGRAEVDRQRFRVRPQRLIELGGSREQLRVGIGGHPAIVQDVA